MEQVIRERAVMQRSQIQDKLAKRYVFYPMSDLDLSGTQATSPVWEPKIKRARLVLMETLEYHGQISPDEAGGGYGARLGILEMGTDAQVNFLMGEWEQRGMTSVLPLVNVTPAIVMDVEKLLYPEGTLPETLYGLKDHFDKLSLSNNDEVSALAGDVLVYLKDGIDRAIRWANNYCNILEQEIQESRAGKAGRAFTDAVDKYYYKQLNRREPRDKDLDFAPSQSIMNNPQTSSVQTKVLEDSLVETRIMLESQAEVLQKQQELIDKLTAKNTKLEKPVEELDLPTAKLANKGKSK